MAALVMVVTSDGLVDKWHMSDEAAGLVCESVEAVHGPSEQVRMGERAARKKKVKT